MSDKRRSASRIVVRRTERITPHMIRVVFGGEDLAVDNGFTDRYVKLLFPVPGMDNPVKRTYTIRSFDSATQELAIDFVSHGDEGLAGPWAAAAQPGDELTFAGPGGAYAPDSTADWHLLVGDEAALPAIGATLAAMPADAKVIAFVEVADASEEQDLAFNVNWLHRGEVPAGKSEALLAAVRGLTFPNGRVHAIVHGEAGIVRELRRHLLNERGLSKDQLSISGYWRQGRDEDGFQADKRAEREAAAV